MSLTVTRGAAAEYRDDQGRTFFSVSQHIQVLDPHAFAGVSPYVLAEAGMRGEKLHVFFALMVMAVNGMTTWPERPIGGSLGMPFDSIARWVEKHRPRVIPSLPPETAVCDVKMKTAGTPDLPCELMGDLSIVDLKNGVPRAVHSAQLHAYRRLCKIKEARLFSLYSQPDGKIARLVEHTGEHVDWSAMLAAHAVLNWRLMRNIK